MQERLTTQVADALQRILEPRGVIVVIECEHLCMTMRGVRKPGSKTVTSAVRGQLRDPATRAEAMSLIVARRLRSPTPSASQVFSDPRPAPSRPRSNHRGVGPARSRGRARGSPRGSLGPARVRSAHASAARAIGRRGLRPEEHVAAQHASAEAVGLQHRPVSDQSRIGSVATTA